MCRPYRNEFGTSTVKILINADVVAYHDVGIILHTGILGDSLNPGIFPYESASAHRNMFLPGDVTSRRHNPRVFTKVIQIFFV